MVNIHVYEHAVCRKLSEMYERLVCMEYSYQISLKVDLEEAQWTQNAAGLHHSHQHGFGLMSAWRMVNTAKVCLINIV